MWSPNSRGQSQFNNPNTVSAECSSRKPTAKPYKVAAPQRMKTGGISLQPLPSFFSNARPATPFTRNGDNKTKLGSIHPNRKSTSRLTRGTRNQTHNENCTYRTGCRTYKIGRA